MQIEVMTDQMIFGELKKYISQGSLHNSNGYQLLLEIKKRKLHLQEGFQDFYTFCQQQLGLTNVSVHLELNRLSHEPTDLRDQNKLKIMDLLWK